MQQSTLEVRYTERARVTKDGQSASLDGCLYLDFGIEQNRAILNGVNINLKLFKLQTSSD